MSCLRHGLTVCIPLKTNVSRAKKQRDSVESPFLRCSSGDYPPFAFFNAWDICQSYQLAFALGDDEAFEVVYQVLIQLPPVIQEINLKIMQEEVSFYAEIAYLCLLRMGNYQNLSAANRLKIPKLFAAMASKGYPHALDHIEKIRTITEKEWLENTVKVF